MKTIITCALLGAFMGALADIKCHPDLDLLRIAQAGLFSAISGIGIGCVIASFQLDDAKRKEGK